VPQRLILEQVAFLGPRKEPAIINFDSSLTVICGASDTGKSFLVEAIDFALGRSNPPRDIPQRVGYDRLRLRLKNNASPNSWTLERSLSGGGYRLADGIVDEADPMPPGETLKDKHKHNESNNVSGWLLAKIGLDGSRIQKNKAGATNSLSFRNLGKLLLVDEEDIIAQRSPFLSGQYTTATSEYSVLKLLLTGIDDSGMVDSGGNRRVIEQDVNSKIDLLDRMIVDLEKDIEDVPEESELNDQIERLDISISNLSERVAGARQDANAALQIRHDKARKLEKILVRSAEIESYLDRFQLLAFHYRTDIERLQAFSEGGSLFVHLETNTCPLCGATPEQQQHDTTCDANVSLLISSAEAEIRKIEQLADELDQTTENLRAEQKDLIDETESTQASLSELKDKLEEILTPNLDEAVGKFKDLAEAKSIATQSLQFYRRLDALVEQRDQMISSETGEKQIEVKHDLSDSLIDDFAQEVQRTLQKWNFPSANRLHYDNSTRDFVIDGKPRASFGKGFRAITHAAVTLTLMRYCLDNSLPHPGFVLLDSPLLSYWKPEDDTDSLQLAGSDLKERFYQFLASGEARGQVIIIENEHPTVADGSISSIVFTRNPSDGRYGLFPA
jgi:predicted  nucleic acid-binding Zn-ribbon protein